MFRAPAVSTGLAGVVLALASCLVAAAGRSGADLAILGVMKQSVPELPHQAVWHREAIAPERDVVLAGAWPPSWGGVQPGSSIPLGPGMKLGLFLQERASPYRVYTLTIESDLRECFADVLRASQNDTVLSCAGEKSEIYPHYKFVYDARAKRLVSHFSYSPFYLKEGRVESRTPSGRALVVGQSSEHEVAIEFLPGRDPEFTLLARARRSNADARVGSNVHPNIPRWTGMFGPRKSFELILIDHEPGERRLVVASSIGGQPVQFKLPQTRYSEFVAARRREVESNPGFPYSIDEEIGPVQVEGELLWFGKTFYDGEGLSGVGGVGYFSPADRRFHIFTSPEIADWSVSTLLVQRDAVWLALHARGEYGDGPGGVLRFDKRTRTFTRIDRTATGWQFLALGDDTVLLLGSGLTVLRRDKAEHYMIDKTTDGRLRVVPALR